MKKVLFFLAAVVAGNTLFAATVVCTRQTTEQIKFVVDCNGTLDRLDMIDNRAIAENFENELVKKHFLGKLVDTFIASECMIRCENCIAGPYYDCISRVFRNFYLRQKIRSKTHEWERLRTRGQVEDSIGSACTGLLIWANSLDREGCCSSDDFCSIL